MNADYLQQIINFLTNCYLNSETKTSYSWDEYILIKNFYNDKKTFRSNVLLMNHIDEGLSILNNLGASLEAKKAYCLHPIVQNKENIDTSWSSVNALAEEYRDKANLYLCKPENDYIETIEQLMDIVGYISEDCLYMLLADKIQNRKDFNLYHKKTHERSEQLTKYFNLWINFLLLELSFYFRESVKEHAV